MVSQANPPQVHQTAASTSIPWPRPSAVGLSAIRPVTWVKAKTKTRSKNSSSGVTLCSYESSRSGSGSSGVVIASITG